jgi:hypothetical protein
VSAVDSPERVLVELWISFVSLVQSYVAAHDIGKPVGRALVDAGENGRLTIRGSEKILVIEFEVKTGMGQWSLYEDGPGPERALANGGFRMTTDSMVEFSDRRGRLEMEIAAEAFTAKIFEDE